MGGYLILKKELYLSYAIGQLRVHSLTPSMSVPRRAIKEVSK